MLVLAQLLQEDYLKLKPSLLLPLLVVLADEESDIAGLARSALTHLLGQQGSKAQHAFIDTVFYLNGCASSSLHVDAFPRVLSATKRRVVFDFLLGELADEGRLMTASKLCQEVLGAVVDGRLAIDQVGVSAVVHDTLTLLASDAMRFQSKPSASSPADDDGDDPDDPAKGVEDRLKAAKGRLLSQVAKRSALESIVPIVMELKRKMEGLKSPLVQPVLLYLQAMYGEWREEMMEILSHDRQLAVEFDFDMRRMEEERKAKSRRSAGLRKKSSSSVSVEPTTPQEVLSLHNVAAAVLSSPMPPPSSSIPVPALPSSAVTGKVAVPFETPSKGPSGGRSLSSPVVFMSPKLKGTVGTPQSGIGQSNRRVSLPIHSIHTYPQRGT